MCEETVQKRLVTHSGDGRAKSAQPNARKPSAPETTNNSNSNSNSNNNNNDNNNNNNNQNKKTQQQQLQQQRQQQQQQRNNSNSNSGSNSNNNDDNAAATWICPLTESNAHSQTRRGAHFHPIPPAPGRLGVSTGSSNANQSQGVGALLRCMRPTQQSAQ